MTVEKLIDTDGVKNIREKSSEYFFPGIVCEEKPVI